MTTITTRIRSIVFALISIVAAGVAMAEESPWVGRLIMDKKGASITADGKDASRLVHWPALVTEAKDGHLRIGRGWIDEKHVIGFFDAEAYYSENIRENPREAWGYIKRAIIYDGDRRLDDAIADFSAAIESDITSPDAYVGRGTVFRRKREFDKAMSDFNAAIELDPRDAQAFVGRAETFNDKGDFDKAIADFNEAIRLDARDDEIYLGRASVFHHQRDFDRAIADCSEAIRINPKMRVAYTNRGIALGLKGEYDKTLADWTEAIRLEPKDYFTLARRSWMRATCPDAKFRNGAAAIEDAAKACELSRWKSSNSIDSLAAAYAEKGEFDRAVEYEKKAIELTGSNERVVAELRKRLELFEQKQPFRDSKMGSAR